jgi:hypothetical protein
VSDMRWKKSSSSAEQTDCVELAHTLDAVRDSKNGVVLRVPVAGLVTAVLFVWGELGAEGLQVNLDEV